VLTTAAGGRRRRARAGATDARTAILDAARRLYRAHGVDGVSARKIAAAVGLSPTAIYLHYRSMEDLLDQLRMEGHALLARYLQDVPAGLPALEHVRAMGRAYWRFGLEHADHHQLMFAAFPRAPRRAAVQREMFTLMLLRDVVRAGVERGEIRTDVDVMVATNALWAQVHGVTALAVAGLLVETAPGQQEQVLDAVLEAAVQGLRP
jgi:AcrR family transcriptional regulator